MSTLQHMVAKLFSGQWLWAVCTAGVFVGLSFMGVLTREDIMTVISVVLGFYFGKSTNKTPEVIKS